MAQRRLKLPSSVSLALQLAFYLALGAGVGIALPRLVPEDLFGDGRLLLLAAAALLLVALPLNGLAVGAKLRSQGLVDPPPRMALYGTTALLWAVIAGIGALGAVQPNGWVTLDPLGPPSSRAWIGVAGGLAVVAVLLLWARDLRTNVRKRARLRLLYRGGTHLVAPRTLAELRAFRLAAVVSSTGEEFAYRLVLLGVLAAFFGPWIALVASSAAFALGHVYQGARAAWATGVFGLAAGALTLWTHSLWPAIVLHIAWNQAVGGILREVYRRNG